MVTGALALPILRYRLGIINWILEETIKIDRKTRKILAMYKIHYPKGDIDRLYVKRKKKKQDILQTEAIHKAEIINIAE
jgi:hypothetical protein